MLLSAVFRRDSNTHPVNILSLGVWKGFTSGERAKGEQGLSLHPAPVPMAPFPQWACLMSQEYSINQKSAAANRSAPKKINENLSTLHCFDGQSLFSIMVPELFLFRL